MTKVRPAPVIADSGETIQVDGPVYREKVRAVERKMIEQEFAKICRTFFTDFKTNCRAVTTCGKLAFQSPNEIIDFFVIEIEIAISRHPKLITTLDRHPGKQVLHVSMNDRR